MIFDTGYTKRVFSSYFSRLALGRDSFMFYNVAKKIIRNKCVILIWVTTLYIFELETLSILCTINVG